MKLLDKIATLINKLDGKLFGRKEAYQPLSGNAFLDVLGTSIVVGIILAIVQIVTKGKEAEEVVGGIGGVIILFAMLRKIWPNLKSPVLGVGAKIGLVFFNLFLAGIAIQLALYVIFLLMALLVGWIILKATGIGSPADDFDVNYKDGTSERKQGVRDVLGNQSVQTRDGRWIDPNDFIRR